jgi:hypothetical protein
MAIQLLYDDRLNEALLCNDGSLFARGNRNPAEWLRLGAPTGPRSPQALAVGRASMAMDLT